VSKTDLKELGLNSFAHRKKILYRMNEAQFAVNTSFMMIRNALKKVKKEFEKRDKQASNQVVWVSGIFWLIGITVFFSDISFLPSLVLPLFGGLTCTIAVFVAMISD